MTDETTEFVDRLRHRGVDPALRNINATVRLDVLNSGWVSHWLVSIDDGHIDVTSSEQDADCVLSADHRVFDGLASGRVNAMAAMIRGELAVSGDPELLVLLQRQFPGPPRTAEPQAVPAAGGRQP